MKRFLLITSIAIFFLLASTILLIYQPKQTKNFTNLPWNIEKISADKIKVFDIIIGESSLLEASQKFKKKAYIALFIPKEGDASLEVYFSQVRLDRLSAKIIITSNIDKADAEAYSQQAVTRKPTPSGAWKLELPDSLLLEVQHNTIHSLTYSPVANFTPELIIKYFGNAEEHYQQEENITHWFYPEKGLAITINKKGKELFHYIQPDQFEVLKQRLMQEPLISK